MCGPLGQTAVRHLVCVGFRPRARSKNLILLTPSSNGHGSRRGRLGDEVVRVDGDVRRVLSPHRRPRGPLHGPWPPAAHTPWTPRAREDAGDVDQPDLPEPGGSAGMGPRTGRRPVLVLGLDDVPDYPHIELEVRGCFPLGGKPAGQRLEVQASGHFRSNSWAGREDRVETHPTGVRPEPQTRARCGRGRSPR